jgi:hypothetical protein
LAEGIPFNVADLTVSGLDMRSRTPITLTAEVVLSDVREKVLYGDKLAVYGLAGNTAAVVIFDLVRREEIDWFYCDGAKQVLPGKLAVAMWVPNHPLFLGDVLFMLYDLAKTPSANRLKVHLNTNFPLPVDDQSDGTTDAGIPIYPQSNVDEVDYGRTVHESGKDVLCANLDTMVAITTQRLVFAARQGFTPQDDDTWLEVLDLPHGTTKARSRRLDLPLGQLHPNPEWARQHQPLNPKWVPISKIEVISPTQVRLHFPEEYSAQSLDVQVPPSD